MNLDEAQKDKVRAWLEQGLKLSEIQNKLASDLDVHLTYMEVRFLIDDLKLKPKDPEPPAPPPVMPAADATKPGAPAGEPAKEPPASAPGGVSVKVDQVTRPGALASGKVTFSDGQTAEWYLDQFGRLGLSPAKQGYKPSQDDVMEFQMALQNELARMGY
ncbi:MAG: hypothetical protein AB1705_03710 [Verrucomicrobiota bacterium]